MKNQSQNPVKEYSQLTSIQQQRYDLLFDMYGHNAIDIVTNVYGKGACSWATFLEKMGVMEEAKRPQKEYYDALYEAFNLYEVYTPGKIISTVNSVRRQLGLPQYTERIKAQSESDFSLLFLYKEKHEVQADDNGEKKVFLGYQPLAKVKPE